MKVIKKIPLLVFAMLLTGCVSTKLTKEYDHFLNEIKITSGTITFMGLMNSQSLSFTQISGDSPKLYAQIITNSSFLSDTQSSSSKLAFLIDDSTRVISKCQNIDNSSFYNNGLTTQITSCKYPLKKQDIKKLSYAKNVSLRIYTIRDHKIERSLSEKDINIIKTFYNEI